MSQGGKSMYEEEVDMLNYMIEEKSLELDTVFADIDRLQIENELLNVEKVEIDCSVNEKQGQKNINDGVKKALLKNRKYTTQCAECIDLSKFDTEHAEVLRKRSDSKDGLELELFNANKELNALESDLRIISTEVSQLESKISQVNIEKDRSASLYNHVKSQINSQERQNKLLNSKIGTLNKNIKTGTKFLKGIEARQEVLLNGPQSLVALTQEIRSLEDKESELIFMLETLKVELSQFRDNAEDEISKLENSKKKAKKIVGWESERAQLKKELELSAFKLKDLEKELKELVIYNSKSKKRLEKLTTLHTKWYRIVSRTGEQFVEEEIDTLLNRGIVRSKKSVQHGVNLLTDLRNVLDSVDQKKKKIESKRRELDKLREGFEFQQSNLKKHIKEIRSNTFDQEQMLIQGIIRLKSKLNAKNKKSRNLRVISSENCLYVSNEKRKGNVFDEKSRLLQFNSLRPQSYV